MTVRYRREAGSTTESAGSRLDWKVDSVSIVSGDEAASVNPTSGQTRTESYPPIDGAYRVADSGAMEQLGRDLAARLRAGDLVVLTGPLGAGKTTLTRGIGAGLGVRGPVTSPTFVLARTHPSLVGGPALVHVDAYRLADAMALDDLDLDLETSVVVVEWGAGLVDGLAESWLDIVIERPTGAGAGAEAEPVAADSTPAARSVSITGSEPDRDRRDTAGVRDPETRADLGEGSAFAEEEPRTVTLRGYGPRWNPDEAPQQP